MPRVRKALIGMHVLPTTRSRLTNGDQFVLPVDGRSAIARRFRDVRTAIGRDFGGTDNLSEGQRQVICRVATMIVQCEVMDATAARGDAIDMELYGRLTDRISRALRSLGRRRSSKPGEADLDSYLRKSRRMA